MNATIYDVVHTPTTDPIRVLSSLVYILIVYGRSMPPVVLLGCHREGHDRTLQSPPRVILFRTHLQRRLGWGRASTRRGDVCPVFNVQCNTVSLGEGVHYDGVIVYPFVEGDC